MYDRKDEAREKSLDIDNYVRQKGKELEATETRLQQLRQDYEPYKAQEELNAIYKYFPMMPEQMRIVGLCEQIGLTFDKTLSGDSVKFYSLEHNQHFEAKNIQLKIEKDPDNSGKIRLSLNGQNILDWFKQKYQDAKQTLKPNIKPIPAKQKRGQGI